MQLPSTLNKKNLHPKKIITKKITKVITKKLSLYFIFIKYSDNYSKKSGEGYDNILGLDINDQAVNDANGK